MRQTATYNQLQAWAKDFFGLELPIPESTYQSVFRKIAMELHPDRGGDEERFKHIMAAHDIFKSFADDPIVFAPEGASTNGHTRRFETEDGTPLSELGLGLGSMKNGVKCLDCDGRGFRETQRRPIIFCRHCHGIGKSSRTCRACSGSGMFRLRSGRFVTCRKCLGTGEYLLGKAVACQYCNGIGYINAGEAKIIYYKCFKCGGSGEVEIDNPVIPKGRLIIKQRK